MRLTSVVIMSAALLLSSAAVAKDKKLASNEQPSASTAVQVESEASAPAEEKVCKRLAVSGTRMFERVCLTKQQWEQVDEQTK